MKIKHLHLLAVGLLFGWVLTACHSDIDLNNIDTTAELEMGVALPVGSMHATVGDFLGNGQVQNIYIDSLNNKGVVTWKDTFDITRNYHKLDLSQYISETTLNLNVYDKVRHLIGANGKVTGDGNPITLDFPITLRLKGINESAKLQDERLDSALIENASFSSIIRQNNLPLKWEWIDQVTLDLGPQINRPAGNTMVVYSRGNGYGYDTSIPTAVDNFSICMMKNRNLTPAQWGSYMTNVIDTCDFQVHFTFTIPAGEEVDVPEDAGFKYNLGVQFIDYKAVWGMFAPSSDMYDEDDINIAESWGDLDFISKWVLPFDEPRVDVHVTTYIAGALVMNGDYLYAEDIDGNKTYATFNQDGRRNYTYRADEQDYLPLTSQIGDSTDRMNFFFNKAEDHGHIDRLFGNMPQKIGYKFAVSFDQMKTPQIRIVPNTSIRVDAVCTLPLIFRNGLFVNYTDTADVDLNKADIDSIINDVKYIDTLKATDIKLVLTAENTIPLDIKATMRCLDAAGNVMMDPDDPTKPLQLTPEDPVLKDTILIKAPNFKYDGGVWSRSENGKSTIIASLNKRKVDMLPLIKKIVYYAQIDESSLQTAYTQGMNNIRITQDNGLKINIGLSTRLDAIFNFDNDKK